MSDIDVTEIGIEIKNCIITCHILFQQRLAILLRWTTQECEVHGMGTLDKIKEWLSRGAADEGVEARATWVAYSSGHSTEPSLTPSMMSWGGWPSTVHPTLCTFNNLDVVISDEILINLVTQMD